MTIELLEDGAEQFVTAGGVSDHPAAPRAPPYAGAIEAYIDGAEHAARRGLLVQLRISGPLHALGHRDHRSADGHFRAWPRHAHRGAERPRRSAAAAHPASTVGSSAEVTLSQTRSGLIRARGRRARPRLHRGGAQPACPPSSPCSGRSPRFSAPTQDVQSRPLRRLRLRPRLPVRPDRPYARARRQPARPRALSAGRDSGRRSPQGDGLARPVRLFRRRRHHRGPAARRKPPSRSSRRTASRRAATMRLANMPGWSRRPRTASSAATCSRSCRADVLRALRDATFGDLPPPEAINPSPYSFFINLGDDEYLIGASPEMFVRVNGRRVETCPISGTIERGDDAISGTPSRSGSCSTRRRTSPS